MESKKTTSTSYYRIVIKIGTNILGGMAGKIDTRFIEQVAAQVEELKKQGRDILIVSSGAIGMGMNELGWKERPKTLPERQALASIGQSRLMHIYDEIFSKHGLRVAQVLLTEYDLRDRSHYLNARNTLLKLLDLGVIPIINENDAVAVDELKIGDNDTLSARVASKVGADLLILLTDVDGLYNKNPQKYKDAKIIPVVEKLTDELQSAAEGAFNHYGTGGMATKLLAARMAMGSGVTMYIAHGTRDGILLKVANDEGVGTKFIPNKTAKLSSREKWIAYGTGIVKNYIFVDDGARKALVEKGKSLLPSGIKRIEGTFKPGDVVRVMDLKGQIVARGLVNYSSDDLEKIKGLKSSQIPAVLGHKAYEEAIHRDNLVLLAEKA
jgi:glutamate 5-kinase